MNLVFMGVSGCGKSTLGTLVAGKLNGHFVEGDRFHPPANVEKMRGGAPLDDEDRAGWLEALAGEIRRHREVAPGSPLCLSCSALKRKYRDVLRSGDADLALVFMRGSRTTLEARVHDRTHDYMPAGLLDSQLAALEAPEADEPHLTVDIDLDPESQAAAVLDWTKRLRDAL